MVSWVWPKLHTEKGTTLQHTENHINFIQKLMSSTTPSRDACLNILGEKKRLELMGN